MKYLILVVFYVIFSAGIIGADISDDIAPNTTCFKTCEKMRRDCRAEAQMVYGREKEAKLRECKKNDDECRANCWSKKIY